MEAGESGTRQSGFPTSSNAISDRYGHHKRDSFERPPFREGPTMATAALISPSTPYHPHHPPSFASGYHAGPGSHVPAMVSPAESRRPSDDNEPSQQRQSLPSLHEVITGKPAAYPPAPAPMPASQNLPSPFSNSTPTRPYSEVGAEKLPSPRALHPAPSYPRAETMPAFSDPARPPLSARPPPPPLNSFANTHASPPLGPELRPRHEAEQRQAESQQLNGASYPHPPAQHQPPIAQYAQSGQLPPGQLPLSGYPISPHHTGPPPLPSPFEAQRPLAHPDDPEFGRNRKYETTLHRHFEAWNYIESLAKLGATSRTVFNFADCYANLAREEHSNQPIPNRHPTEREYLDMLNNVELIRNLIETLRAMSAQHNAMSERAAKESSRPKPPVTTFEEEDISMYDGSKNYAMSEVKKRRGRAAPPGRCHSCNRIDTPEWRRGPDGARTLCNACGLHYAKLERKRQLENRSLRPKPADGGS